MTFTAKLNNYRQSPRKVRLVANVIKGKPVVAALNLIKATVKAASAPLEKLLRSALANAKQRGVNEDILFVKSISVDGGAVMKRMMPRARGSAYQILKRTSRVSLVLEEKGKKAAK